MSGTGSHVVVGLLDELFQQIAIWVDPDANDFFNVQTGLNSADAVTAWAVPAGGLTNFVSYSLIRNRLDDVKFDDVMFARRSTDVGIVGIAAIPEPETYAMMLMGLGLIGFFASRRKATRGQAGF